MTPRRPPAAPPPLFITGTDTGVGKTVFTALLLAHCRDRGVPALAVKPFASGSRADARLFRALQGPSWSLDTINPFHFPDPLTPLLAARRSGRRIVLSRVLDWLAALPSETRPLLIEGAGGLLSPLGPDYTLREIIRAVRGHTVLVAPNRLGVLNQVLLTREALRATGLDLATVVLMTDVRPDASAADNPRLLRELLPGVPILVLPHLGSRAARPAIIRRHAHLLRPLGTPPGLR